MRCSWLGGSANLLQNKASSLSQNAVLAGQFVQQTRSKAAESTTAPAEPAPALAIATVTPREAATSCTAASIRASAPAALETASVGS